MASQRILVAEDDPSVRLTIQFVLEDEGFEVLLAADGQEALDLAMAAHPDAILLDQMMPKMDGKEVLAAIRAEASTEATPVLVLTGMARGAPEDWPGAHFIGKPFSPEFLVERLKALLGS